MNLARLKERFHYFRTHRFVQNFAILQFSNIGNIIQALIGILLVRILKPELYGIYALAFGLAGVMTVFLGLGAQDAVTTIVSETYARNDKEGTYEAMSFLAWSTLVLAAAAFIGALFAPWIGAHFYHNYQIGVYAAIIIVATVVSTFFYTFSTMALQIVGRIKSMTVLIFADQVTRTGLSLLFVLWGLGVFGAMLGHLVGAVIVLITSIIIWETIKRHHPIFPSFRELFLHPGKIRVKKYLGFSFWISVDRNISNLYNNLPILLTGLYVATAQVTYFKLAFGYVNLALSFLGPVSILLSVEFPKMKVLESGNLAKNFIKVSLYSLLISFVLTGGALLVAPIAFHILYGAAINQSIPYVYGLFVYGAFIGIGVGLGPMWRAINKVKTSILINVVTLGLGIPLGMYLIKHYGLWGSVIMVTLWYTLSHWFSFLYLAKKLNEMEKEGTYART